MGRSQFLLLLLFLFIFSGASAATFTVTSNADSGPGTLRQALLDAEANGSAEKDFIVFNLPDQSEAGRTITISSSLPNLSSNLVIDGTSQTGNTFKLTDAKVKIATPINYIMITVFNGADLTDVEFYGLYIFDYSDILISRPDLKARKGFNLIRCSDITIGAAHKGNRISGFNVSSIDIEESDRVKIKNNVISIGDDDGSFNTNNGSGGFTAGYGGTIDILKCNNIEFGGDPGEGNIIFTIVNFKFYQLSHSKVSIRSNNFLVYPDGLSTEWYFEYYSGTVFFSTIFSSDTRTTEESLTKEAIVDMDISNNLTGCQIGIFRFEFINGTVNVTHNYLNVARDGVTPIKYLTQIPPAQGPFGISNCYAQFNFGSNNINDRNYFYNVYDAISDNNSPNVFIRYNEYACVVDVAYTNNTGPTFPGGGYQLPTVSISSINSATPALITGKATPNSLVDIYSSENCQSKCSIHSYIKTVAADASGNWQTSVNNLGGVFYVSATLNNQTSKFKSFEVNTDNITIKPLRCGNGSITGLIVPQGLSYYWTDYNGNIVSHDLDLITDKPGNYRLVLGEGCITSNWFQIEDKRLNIYDGFAVKTNASCGNHNGGIKNLFVYDPLSKLAGVVWTDANGNEIGHSADISGLSPGVYKLTVKSTDGCSVDYTLNLTDANGPSLNQANAVISPTPCGQSTGSISGIVANGTGTLKYSWKNAQGTQVATTKDLTNQPAGTYVLSVTDDTQCGIVSTTPITIAETNGITINDAGKQISQATCQNNDGSITNILAQGATDYKWYNSADTFISNQLSLTGVAPGSYYLMASNATGCSKQSATYVITRQAAPNYGGLSKVLKNATCGLNNGSIQVIFQNSPPALPVSYRWVNHSTGATVGITNSPIISNLDAGTYDIYTTNNTGCEAFLIAYSILRTPGMDVSTTSLNIGDDECGLSNGSIKGINATGVAPLSFKWTNASGQQVASSNDLTNQPAGKYTLLITDGSGCQFTNAYTIYNGGVTLPPPAVTDLQLCSTGEALLKVNNTSSAYGYRLYNDQTDPYPLDDQASGTFKIKITDNRNYYVSQYRGNCESTRARVMVTLGSVVKISNAFTPNGDGVNDTWEISNIKNYPDALVQIFTRAGNKVFESKGYAISFNGNYNGNALPAGVYYYIINFNTGCSLLSGSLTIIR